MKHINTYKIFEYAGRTATEALLLKISEVFESAWEKEMDRFNDIIKGYKSFKVVKGVKGGTTGKLGRADKVQQYVAIKLMGSTAQEIDWYGVHGLYKAGRHKQFQKYVGFLRLYESDKKPTHRGKTLKQWYKEYKESFKEFMMLKFQASADKHLQGWKLGRGEVKVIPGVKGYEIIAPVVKDGEKATFTTRANGAGGWNIQAFHYRYRSNMKKK